MAASSDSWGGDYSFLLQSIEGQISENIVNKTPKASSKSATDESSSKRRWSDFQSPGEPGGRDSLMMSSAKKMKSFAEMDELAIINEQLRDSVARLESERQIARDEHLRQLKFLDDRCTSLKKESTERLEKYYEEKKKWQSKHRELEQLAKKASSASTSSNAQPAASSSVSSGNGRNEEVLQRLQQLESELSAKVAESRENMKGRLNAESKLFEAEMELKTLRTSLGAGSMADEAAMEARLLRKQYADLESVHKRTARDHDAMKAKLKNQSLLEEELSTLKAKLRLTEEKLNTFKQEQIEYQQLLEEKGVWTQLFHEIIARPEHSDVLDDAAIIKIAGTAAGATSSSASAPFALGHAASTAVHVAPTAVLQLLSAYQSRCAVLLQGTGQLQQSHSELRRQARESQMQLLDSETALHSTQSRLETVEHQLRTALQQGRLYDGEIRSLRSLLETYDLEFRIGKPDAVKVMALKDRLTADLRAELDGARQSALAMGAQVRALEATVEQRTATVAALEGELDQLRDAVAAVTNIEASASAATDLAVPAAADALRTRLEEAEHDLHYLQHVTGLDYLPDRTRVLHMPRNPTSHAPAVTTLPSVTELRHQRALHKRHFTAALAEAVARVTEGMEADAAHLAEAAAATVPASSSGMQSQSTIAPSATAAVVPVAAPAPAADNAIMNMRLKEQFKERIASFREAVYLITGYKMDLYAADGSPNSLPRLRLRSMYAEKPEDYLLFQMRGDCPELLDTEYASRLDPAVLYQLTHWNSVPAFVSAITMDLVEKQTM